MYMEDYGRWNGFQNSEQEVRDAPTYLNSAKIANVR